MVLSLGVVIGVDRDPVDGEALPALANLATAEPDSPLLQDLGKAVSAFKTRASPREE